MAPADSASRAGAMPEASRDRSLETLAKNMKLVFVIAIFLAAAVTYADEQDLRHGTIDVPDGYKFFHDGTIDSFMGRLVRSDDNFTISFDIGMMAGIAVPRLGTLITPVFFRRHSINGIPAATEIRKTENGSLIVTTVSYELTKGIEPANFRAKLSSQADVAEFLTIVGTYRPKQ